MKPSCVSVRTQTSAPIRSVNARNCLRRPSETGNATFHVAIFIDLQHFLFDGEGVGDEHLFVHDTRDEPLKSRRVARNLLYAEADHVSDLIALANFRASSGMPIDDIRPTLSARRGL